MIEIINLMEINKGAMKASVNIRLPKMKNFQINNVLIWEKEGKKWVSLPSREYEIDGKKKFFPFCGFEDKDLNEGFKSAILKAFETHMQGTQPSIHKTEEVPF